MVYTVSAAEEKNINFLPESVTKEVLQNVWFILNTTEYDCPLARGIGLSSDLIDRPVETAQALGAANIFDKIETYEPRAEVLEANFRTDHKTGKIYAVVEVAVNEEYDGEEYTK